jgi:hypothetical protein
MKLMINLKQIKKWEIWGAIFSIVLGSLMHFVFDWSGGIKIVAFFGAVNESTWEHLKLAFWPTLIFSIVEWFVFGKELKNYCLATFLKLFSMPIIITVLFYGWLVFFQDNFVWDISIFVIAVITGYCLSFKILKIDKELKQEKISLFLIIVSIIVFSLFTYYPPKYFLTIDPVKGGYGIE